MKKHFVILGALATVGLIMWGLSVKSNNKIASDTAPASDISNPVSEEIIELENSKYNKKKYQQIHLKILSYQSTDKISAKSRILIDEMLEDAYAKSLWNEFENWYTPPFSSLIPIKELMDEIEIQKEKSSIPELSNSIAIYANYKQALRLPTKTKHVVAKEYDKSSIDNLKSKIRGLTTNIEYASRDEIKKIKKNTLQKLQDFKSFNSTYKMWMSKDDQRYKLKRYCEKLDEYLYYKSDTNWVEICN